MEAARSANTDFPQLDRHTAFNVVQSHAPAEPIEVIADRIEKVSREVLIAEQAPRLRDQLKNDDQFIDSIVSNIGGVALAEVQLKQIDLSFLLQSDSTLREALANQVQVAVKRQGRENPDDPVGATCTAVGQLKAIKNVLGENGVDDSTRREIATQLAEKELYQPEAIERVRATAAALYSDGTLERIYKVIGRLRNDQQVKTALRSPEIPLLIE